MSCRCRSKDESLKFRTYRRDKIDKKLEGFEGLPILSVMMLRLSAKPIPAS